MIKLQHLAVIFVILIIPISLVLGYYVQSEIDTLKLQATYDSAMLTATYDAIKAFQINTAKNPYAIINGSKRRDIEAAVNTFVNSYATALGSDGYSKNTIKSYMPAVVFTLYDGYFIYAPTECTFTDTNGVSKTILENILKPYITYTQRYVRTGIDVYITYSLDNYIAVTGKVNGKYVNKSGYLISGAYSADEEMCLYESLLLYDDVAGHTNPRSKWKSTIQIYFSRRRKIIL